MNLKLLFVKVDKANSTFVKIYLISLNLNNSIFYFLILILIILWKLHLLLFIYNFIRKGNCFYLII